MIPIERHHASAERDSMNKIKKKNIGKRITIGVFLVILFIAIGCIIYLGNYYRASQEAIEVISNQSSTVTITESKNDRIIFQPQEPVAGLIFYPGGKVQYEAYSPLMQALAERGILCVLVHMPGNLAVLDSNAADGIPEEFPEVSNWYIGGHSLGGAMAASFASKHTQDYNGLVLLGAYSTVDLSQSGLQVVSIYGSEDGVMNRDSYVKNKANLPEDWTEVIIEGGCHAYFGDYGHQDGDGVPTISNEEQIQQTADAILAMMKE